MHTDYSIDNTKKKLLPVNFLVLIIAPMEHKFTISFEYDCRKYDLCAKFVRLGFIHQFHVSIDDTVLIVEYDEERNYRVINSNGGALRSFQSYEPGFLKALVDKTSSLH